MKSVFTRSYLLALVALTVIALAVAPVMANLIKNESFENGTDPYTSFIKVTAPDSTTITNWTVSANTVDYIGTRWTASEGSRSIDMNGTSAGTLEQTITATLGTTYVVTFAMSGNPDGYNNVENQKGNMQIDVKIAGNTYSFYFDTTGNSNSDMGWTDKTFHFIAKSKSETLQFISKEIGGYGSAIDNVRMEVIPLPASALLLGSGLLGLSLHGFRRKRRL